MPSSRNRNKGTPYHHIEKGYLRMSDVLGGEITITKSSHRPTNGFVGTLFIYAEETAMKKARQIVKPSASLFSKNHLLFLAFVLYFQKLILEERGRKETASIQNPQSHYSVSAFDF